MKQSKSYTHGDCEGGVNGYITLNNRAQDYNDLTSGRTSLSLASVLRAHPIHKLDLSGVAINLNSAAQNQKAVTAHLKSEQSLPSGLARQNSGLSSTAALLMMYSLSHAVTLAFCHHAFYHRMIWLRALRALLVGRSSRLFSYLSICLSLLLFTPPPSLLPEHVASGEL